MMKKRLIVMGILLLVASRLWATPASKIELAYNTETQILSIKVYHPSEDTHEHYIRRIYVYKNDEEVSNQGFPAQLAWGMATEMKVEAKPGDKLEVKAVCAKAGIAEEALVVPESAAK